MIGKLRNSRAKMKKRAARWESEMMKLKELRKINTLNSSQPAYLRSLLSYHIPARSLRSSNTNLMSVPRVHTTFAFDGFSVAVPSVWNSLPAGIHACSSSHILSVVFLKPTASSRPLVSPSGSHKCLRFGLWWTLCTIKDFTYLLAY